MGLLDNKTAIVTGSSRGIGADVAKYLAAEGADVVVNYRQKAPRANKVVAEIEAAGGRAAAVGADLTTQEGVQALASAAMENFGSLDVLVLNASGGMETGMEEGYALKLNRDAQVNMLNAAVPLMREGSRVVFVTSHQAHFIDSVPTMPEYEPVARSKRAGEDALRELIPNLAEKGISLVVVSGDMIEGTVTATLLDRSTPGAIEARRAEAGRLYSVSEFAAEVAKMATADVETGHTEYVGGSDYFGKNRQLGSTGRLTSRRGPGQLPRPSLVVRCRSDPGDVPHGVEIRHVHDGVGGGADGRLGVEGHADPGGTEHVQVVGAVAHRDGVLQRDAFRGGPFAQVLFLGSAVDHIAEHPAGQRPVHDFQLVGDPVVQPQALGDRLAGSG